MFLNFDDRYYFVYVLPIPNCHSLFLFFIFIIIIITLNPLFKSFSSLEKFFEKFQMIFNEINIVSECKSTQYKLHKKPLIVTSLKIFKLNTSLYY